MKSLKILGLVAATAAFSFTLFVSPAQAQRGWTGWRGDNGNHYGWWRGRHRGWDRNRAGRVYSQGYYRQYRTPGYYPYSNGYGNYGYNNYGYNNYGYNNYRYNAGSTILNYLGLGNLGYRNYGYNNGYYYGDRYIGSKERRKMMKRYWKAQRKAYRSGWY